MYGLFFLVAARAATVYLNPPDSLPSHLLPQQASLALAAHLGLEHFEVVNQPAQSSYLFSERDFVGQGDKSALLLLVDEAYARDVIPSSISPSFSFFEASSESVASLFETCTQRAKRVYTHVTSQPAMSESSHGVPKTLDIFSAPTPANEAYLNEASTLIHYLDALPASDRFAALELTGIPQLATTYGTSSQQYGLAVGAVRGALEIALADRSVRLALVTYSPNAKRRSALVDQSSEVIPELNPPKVQLSSSSSCFNTSLTCNYATDGCSGHGQCTNVTRAGKDCFVCACTITQSESGTTQNWAGESCQRQDISGPFVLIAGTVITLMLLIGGSVSLLYAISTHDLPSILTGGVAGGVRKE